jgi:RNA polymerase Rpb4
MEGSSHDDNSNNSNGEEDPTDVPYLINNLAVLEMLQTRVEARKGRKRSTSSRQHQHCEWVEAKVVEYLQGTTAAVQFGTARNAAALQKVLRSNKKMTRAAAAAADGTVLVSTTAGFDLTEAESLQIVNLAPTEPVEIHLLVEELHDRMTARKQEELLATIQSYRVVAQENGKQHATNHKGVVAMDDEDSKPPAAGEE